MLTTQYISEVQYFQLDVFKPQRLMSASYHRPIWQFAEAELAEGYHVTVEKLSGETPRKTFNSTRPEINLVLSHSAYLLNISAFHSAATSPALEWTIAPLVDKGDTCGYCFEVFLSWCWRLEWVVTVSTVVNGWEK